MKIGERRVKERFETENKRCYFNTFEGAGDYFRGIKYLNRDLDDIESLNTIDQVSLVIFFILSHRNIEKASSKLRKILIGIYRINTSNLRYQFESYLDRNRQSIMITYLMQAMKELEDWTELSNRDYDELKNLLLDVGERIL